MRIWRIDMIDPTTISRMRERLRRHLRRNEYGVCEYLLYSMILCTILLFFGDIFLDFVFYF